MNVLRSLLVAWIMWQAAPNHYAPVDSFSTEAECSAALTKRVAYVMENHFVRGKVKTIDQHRRVIKGYKFSNSAFGPDEPSWAAFKCEEWETPRIRG